MSGRIELRPDGPHSDDYTAEVARALAESVRVLNYATGSHAERGLQHPQTVYDVVGNLAASAAGLGQLLGQLAEFLTHQAAAGHLADTSGADPIVVTADAREQLAAAHTAGSALSRALGLAQSAVSGLYVLDGDAESGDWS
ncbi:hypothetical protein [Actinomadura xylanilytica]|uniref:hypothetical protein n=1 Tax=Actinomadura xylanilytica TaxID=887459 RepID=UPI00255AA022|nr:hypothetical protein [Actinomadura xylanilytica]MDL4772488.1 hypothetical protein [Actinomadura xylanilytica]